MPAVSARQRRPAGPRLSPLRRGRYNPLGEAQLAHQAGLFLGEEYLEKRGFDFTKPLKEAVQVFSGSAREAAAAFPRHFNVAISLSLAGVGFDKTKVDIWADPTIPGAIHNVEVEADEVVLSMTSRNRPSEANPKTSRIIAPSVLATLRSMVAPLHVGS